MPYKSAKQQRFFEGCRANPGKMGGNCPDRKTLNEFHNAEFHTKSKPKLRKMHKVGKTRMTAKEAVHKGYRSMG